MFLGLKSCFEMLSLHFMSSAVIPKSHFLWMMRRSKELIDVTSVVCLTWPLTSLGNACEVLKGAGVKVGSSS